MKIAFYAPLKPPGHPVPSGDRLMARLLIGALARAGHSVEVASELRSYALDESGAEQEAIRAAGEAEAERLVALWRKRPEDRPDLWFTYHLYYRAPDWVGPRMAATLGIPYVVAEASFAMKRADGAWAIGHQGTARALRAARLVFCLSVGDRPGLESAPGFTGRIVDLPPFIDPSAWDVTPRRGGKVPVLLAAGMMRARGKLDSYRILGRVLAGLGDLPWRLEIAGDGPARGDVEKAFADLGPERVRLLGALAPDALANVYASSDLFVWPGFDEAYGMVYLEAQASGLPVVAMSYGGVANVVRDGVSGRLLPAGDEAGYAAALRELLGDAKARARLGASARAFVRKEHSLELGEKVIGEALESLVTAA